MIIFKVDLNVINLNILTKMIIMRIKFQIKFILIYKNFKYLHFFIFIKQNII
jgi:hypothetical protein